MFDSSTVHLLGFQFLPLFIRGGKRFIVGVVVQCSREAAESLTGEAASVSSSISVLFAILDSPTIPVSDFLSTSSALSQSLSHSPPCVCLDLRGTYLL